MKENIDILKELSTELLEKETLEYMDKEYLSKFSYAVIKPNTYTAGDKSEELGNKWGNVTEYIRNGSWDAIYADSDEQFDSIVKDMQTKAYAAGYEDCVEWCVKEAAVRKSLEE